MIIKYLYKLLLTVVNRVLTVQTNIIALVNRLKGEIFVLEVDLGNEHGPNIFLRVVISIVM